EVNTEIAAAFVGEMKVKRLSNGIARRRGSAKLSDNVERKSGLRRFEQIQITEVRNLDPSLTFTTQLNAQRINDGAEPGGYHKGGIFEKSVNVFRDFRDAGTGLHINAHARPARANHPIHGVNDPGIQQRIGQKKYAVSGSYRKNPVEVV